VSRRRSVRWACAVALLLALANGMRPRAELDLPAARAGAQESERRAKDASTQLARARGVQAALRARGESEEAARAGAVRAFRAVRRFFPGAKAEGAEGALRAAELLRADGQLEAARRELEVCRRLADSTELGQRALLELGHMARREERWERALDAYERVALESPTQAAHGIDAQIWCGRVHLERGDLESARRWLRKATETPWHAALRIRAFDWLARTWIVAGDLEACAGVLEECRLALASVTSEQTQLGERARQALGTMRARALLVEALIERRRAKEEPRQKK